jgi:short-subunit dehydrogenase
MIGATAHRNLPRRPYLSRPAEKMNSFQNTTIVMTGGSGGIGSLVAAQLQRDGAQVTVLSRSDEVPHKVTHISSDLSTLEGIAAAQSVIVRERPDILINMAGVQYFGPLERQRLDELHRSYMINLVAPVSLCQACLPAMRERNSGQIVNVGSVMGSIPFAYFATYSSAKGGLRAFSEALRRELAGTAIAVTHISPRAVKTALLTPEVEKYIQVTKMNVDNAAPVAASIADAIKQRRKDVFVGFPESMFVRLNALLPGLVDSALAKSDLKAKAVLSSLNS